MVLSIGIVGISGRMGKLLCEEICKDESLLLIGGVRKSEPLTLNDDIDSLVSKADSIIDFSSPDALLSIIKACVKHSKPLISGTTGFGENEEKAIIAASKKIPIIVSSNFSLGLALCKTLIKEIAGKFKSSSVHIVDTQQSPQKKPSDTSLSLAKTFFENGIFDIDIQSIRNEKDICRHTISFCSLNEKIDLSLEEFSKKSAAEGSIKCARFLHGKPAKIYSVEEAFSSNY